MCKRYNTSSNFRALEGEKTRAFFWSCFFCGFCKLANGSIHPPIWPPLLRPFFNKKLLLEPSCDYWGGSFQEGLKMTQKVSKRVPKGAPRWNLFIHFPCSWTPEIGKRYNTSFNCRPSGTENHPFVFLIFVSMVSQKLAIRLIPPSIFTSSGRQN